MVALRLFYESDFILTWWCDKLPQKTIENVNRTNQLAIRSF